jgi:acyl carrier protein
MLTREEVYSRVSATLMESLNLDRGRIKPWSTLQGDLGAESIDLLDLVFQLEKQFGIHVSADELFPETLFQGNPRFGRNPEFVQGDQVTKRGLEELRVRMPFAELRRFERNPRLSEIGNLFTVDMIVRYIHGKLAESSAA